MRTAGLRLEQAPPLDIPLRFFVTAPAFTLAAGLLLLWRGGVLLATPLHPAALALAHLVTLGWLSMVMVGAIYQIVPVLAGVVVPAAGLGRWVHAGLTLGTAALAAGLLLGWPALLYPAAGLLAAAFLVLLAQLAPALAGAGVNATGIALRLAVAALACAVGFGLIFALEHALGHFLPRRSALVGVHLYLGLAGWMGWLITGVGFAVLPMFYLTPPFPPGRARWVLLGLGWAVLSAAPVLLGTEAWPWRLAPWAGAAGAWGVFFITVLGLLRARRRKVSDPTLALWLGGLAAAGLALAALAAHTLHPAPRLAVAFAVLFLVGGVASIELGMLCKIVPFLVWLHRFSRRAGKEPVPLMRDILPLRRAERLRLAHLAAVVLLSAAALAPADATARLAGLALAGSGAYGLYVWVAAARFRGPAPRA